MDKHQPDSTEASASLCKLENSSVAPLRDGSILNCLKNQHAPAVERNYDEKMLDYYKVSIYADDLKGPVCEIQLSIKVWKYSSKHCERGKMMYHVISRLCCGPALCVNINGHYWQIKAQK